MVQIGLPKRVPQKRPKPFILNGLERFFGTLFGRPFFGRSAPMQRGARFFWRRSALMQRGARFWIVIFFPVNLVVVCGTNEGVQNIYKTNAFAFGEKDARPQKTSIFLIHWK